MTQISAVRVLLVCIVLLTGLLLAVVAAWLPTDPAASWAGRVRNGAVTFVMAVTVLIALLTAVGLL
ncbi:succinate dehydrogenase hydrophobic anchor subunit [Kitasatospora sp. MAA4]|uniref:hypothetical protein n=1 Tax=Kitasatospora sp. MAA4 TaxID=3035093 RepID=UPI002473246C|nr:hypothetical protein [Kitasatospora sp. MAA4]MDH6132662.1 succinate dehydrogenase hydrophobic anchor subunit [Kitasatospora sp. MAA4]